MTLSPIRRGPSTSVVALFRPVSLVWLLGVIAVGAGIGSAPVAWAKLGAGGWMLVAGGIPARRAIAQDRRRHLQERLHTRAPRRTDPGDVPPPGPRSAGRRQAAEQVAFGVGMLMVAGILAGTPFIARAPDDFLLGLPPAAAWVVMPLTATAMTFEFVGEWRKARRSRTPEASPPRSTVTVLGFSGPSSSEVVVVPGEVVVPSDPATGSYDAVLAAPLSLRKLRDVIPGDVLVCDGTLEAGTSVHLSNGTSGAWSAPLRAVRDEELAPPFSWREELRTAAEEARRVEAERHERRQDRIARRLPPLDGPDLRG